MTCPIKRLLSLASLAAIAALPFPQTAQAQHAQYDALVATHAMSMMEKPRSVCRYDGSHANMKKNT